MTTSRMAIMVIERIEISLFSLSLFLIVTDFEDSLGKQRLDDQVFSLPRITTRIVYKKGLKPERSNFVFNLVVIVWVFKSFFIYNPCSGTLGAIAKTEVLDSTEPFLFH